MAKNRILPYGYRIIGGKTATEPEEVEIIRRIYRCYADGISYNAIAQALTAECIRYMPDKPLWNKNMVARILQNQNYLGTVKYPPIVMPSTAKAAQQAQKPYTHTEPQDIKTLKPLLVCATCGEPIRRRLKSSGGERWYCTADAKHVAVSLSDHVLLESIFGLQQCLVQTKPPVKSKAKQERQISLETIRLQNEIDLDLGLDELDVESVKAKMMELAALRYTLIPDTNDDCENIISQIKQLDGAELSSVLLRKITAQILVQHNSATALLLKNGEIIEIGE